jgi:ribosomal protein S6--L-glutamate ligase
VSKKSFHVPSTIFGNALLTNLARVITKNNELPELFHTLAAGDIIACRLRLKYEEEHLLLDLVERGVLLIPSATSQLASRSKTFQARLLAPYMIPQTVVIYDIHGLLDTVSLFGHHGVGEVVLKHDRKNAGLGIHLYRNIEDVYNQAANNSIPYPFVIQPFVADSRDIRVIILDDYTEAYERQNPDNFRNNLHCGGDAEVFQLNAAQLALCNAIMKRASFPYAHLDLMITEKNEVYLAEINLRGGIRGAVIDPSSYQKKVEAIDKKLLLEKL